MKFSSLAATKGYGLMSLTRQHNFKTKHQGSKYILPRGLQSGQKILFRKVNEDHLVRINNKNVIEVLPLLSTDTKLSEETQLTL